MKSFLIKDVEQVCFTNKNETGHARNKTRTCYKWNRCMLQMEHVHVTNETHPCTSYMLQMEQVHVKN